jgi:hypothetical protein
MLTRSSPGPCPICGAAHTACTATTGPVVIDQLPAMTSGSPELEIRSLEPPADLVPPEADPPVEFTTGTYERAKHGARAVAERTKRR